MTTHDKILKEIQAAVGSIRYGSIEIVIHDSKVVQIERKEKLRFSVTVRGGDGEKEAATKP